VRHLKLAALLLAAAPAFPRAQAPAEPVPPPTTPDMAPSQAPPPTETPPPEMPPPPPQAAPAVPPAAVAQPPAAPAGQWVRTVQYGWLWIPYGQEYTYIPADPQVFPEEYVYYPVYGWRWVAAPWVFGYGPEPLWGAPGIRLFAWYTRPWFRVGGHWGWGGYRGWGRYRGWLGPRTWGPRGWVGAPSYYRTGVGERHPVPAGWARPERRERERERSRRER
jgi:hypothetical protein